MKEPPKLKVTKRDMIALGHIRDCGFIAMEVDGQPRLETSRNVTKLRFRRLVALGLVRASGDNLLPEAPSQTYVLAQS